MKMGDREMDQLIVWAFVHHELSRQDRRRPRCDDAFYRNDRHQDSHTVRLMRMVWPGL
jgi:hypothetical protein